MKILDIENNVPFASQAAKNVLEITPHIMRAVRRVMRSHRTPDLSIPQFRALGFLQKHEGASLSDVANHIGLQPPTMSKMIDALVARGLVERNIDQEDRRRVTLTLSDKGRKLWQKARQATNDFLTEKLAALPDEDLLLIVRAMECLRPLFAPGSGKEQEDNR
jgi:DNA-binding MarR family transcriptional regulator